MEKTLTIQLEDRLPVAVLRLSGFLAQLEVYKLKAQVEQLVNAGYRFLIFDLSPLVFMDSAGIGVLMHARAECLRVSGQIVIVQSASRQVAQAFNQASLHKMLDVFEDATAALTYLSNKYGLAIVIPPEAPPQDATELLRQLDARLSRIEQRLSDIEGHLKAKPQP